jgi:hypothetical protein
MADTAYDVVAPNGQKLRLTGDRPPTEEDIRAAFKSQGIDPDKAVAPPVSATAPPEGFWHSLLAQLPPVSKIPDALSSLLSDPGGTIESGAKALAGGIADQVTTPVLEAGRSLRSTLGAIRSGISGDKSGEQTNAADAALHMIGAIPFFGPALVKGGTQQGPLPMPGDPPLNNRDGAGAAGTDLGTLLNYMMLRGFGGKKPDFYDRIPGTLTGAPATLSADPAAVFEKPNVESAPPTALVKRGNLSEAEKVQLFKEGWTPQSIDALDTGKSAPVDPAVTAARNARDAAYLAERRAKAAAAPPEPPVVPPAPPQVPQGSSNLPDPRYLQPPPASPVPVPLDAPVPQVQIPQAAAPPGNAPAVSEPPPAVPGNAPATPNAPAPSMATPAMTPGLIEMIQNALNARELPRPVSSEPPQMMRPQVQAEVAAAPQASPATPPPALAAQIMQALTPDAPASVRPNSTLWDGGYKPPPGTDTVTELLQGLRNQYGSKRAGAMLNPANPAAGEAAILRVASGPSRTPLIASNAELDARYKSGIGNDKGAIAPGLMGAVMRRGPLYVLSEMVSHALGLPYGSGVLGASTIDALRSDPTMLNTPMKAGAAATALSRPDQGGNRAALYQLLRSSGLVK